MSEQMSPDQLSARELAERAGTTVRTVHYYVSEGLLPPPEGSTRGAAYGPGHLARLKVIASLRDEGLSLAAIRSRLSHLSDEDAIGVLATLDHYRQNIESGTVTALGLIEAAVVDRSSETLALDERAPDISSQRMMMSAPMPEEQPPADSARSYVDRMLRRSGEPRPRRGPAPAPRPPAEPIERAPETWYHFEIEDGIELRVSAERFHPDRSRVLRLVDQFRDLAHRHRNRPNS